MNQNRISLPPNQPLPAPFKVREWLTPRQVMGLLGMSKSTFWRRVHEGALVARRDGPRSYRISREALAAYLEENKTFDPAA
jgi:excisionase family DNA binding protein